MQQFSPPNFSPLTFGLYCVILVRNINLNIMRDNDEMSGGGEAKQIMLPACLCRRSN